MNSTISLLNYVPKELRGEIAKIVIDEFERYGVLYLCENELPDSDKAAILKFMDGVNEIMQEFAKR